MLITAKFILNYAIECDKYDILPDAKGCISTGEMTVYARKLTKTTKVFPYWDSDTYMVGKKGDFLAVSADDPHDIFIVEKNMFKRTYSPTK